MFRFHLMGVTMRLQSRTYWPLDWVSCTPATSLSLITCPKDTDIKDERLASRIVSAAVSVLQISMNQDWSYGPEMSEGSQKA